MSLRPVKKRTFGVTKRGYKLKTGKIIPVAKEYRKDWILLKDQPKRLRKKEKDVRWHGTSDVNLDSIKKFGLVMAQAGGLGATASPAATVHITDMIGRVGLTDYMPNAAYYAVQTAVLVKGEGQSIMFMIDRTKLNKESIFIRKGSGAPPAKEWDYVDTLPPSAIVGYWHNIGKVKTDAGGQAYVERGMGRARGWVFFSNPGYRGELGP